MVCRKHSSAMTEQGLANSSARLFSNPAGDYGSMVNERVGSSQWEDGSELGDTWASRNAFSYGRCGTPLSHSAIPSLNTVFEASTQDVMSSSRDTAGYVLEGGQG